MERRYLGQGKLEVSAMGLGCVSFTDFYGRSFDESEAVATVRRALELGVTLFDVADVYGAGRNEALLAQGLKGRRGEVVVATKFGFVLGADGKIAGLNGRPEYVRSACEASLRRLDTEYIDLYFLHRIDPTTPLEETAGAMADLVTEGKVRYLGLSEASAGSVRRANAVHPITALQSEYSLWSRDVEGDVLTTCRELGIGFVAYSPLGRGFLTGKLSGEEDLGAGDFRKVLPRFTGEALRQNRATIGELELLAGERGCTPAQLALAWVLARGGDIVPIPGTKRRQYLEENIAALGVSLAPDDIRRLDEIAARFAGNRYSEAGMRLTNM